MNSVADAPSGIAYAACSKDTVTTVIYGYSPYYKRHYLDLSSHLQSSSTMLIVTDWVPNCVLSREVLTIISVAILVSSARSLFCTVIA